MRKICLIAQFPPPVHGLSKAVDTLYHSELNLQFEFEKVNLTNNKDFFKNLYRIYKSNADIFYLTISQTKGGNLRDLLILKLLYTRHKTCLIHLHGGYYRNLVDNDMSMWQRRANYKAVSRLAGAIVLGESLKTVFQGMIPDEKILVVPNCVENEYLMSDTEIDKKLRTLSERKIKHVLFLSNFIKSKGYPEMLEMAKYEKERCETGAERQFHFDFAGAFFEEKERIFFEEYIRNNHLKEYVTYHGIADGKKKKELLQLCDIFVLLTRYKNEGQPISILEAMGNGMMVITTDHAGIRDIVQDGVTGIFVEEPEAAYREMFYIENKVKMIENAYKQVKKQYLQYRYIENMKKLFGGYKA